MEDYLDRFEHRVRPPPRARSADRPGLRRGSGPAAATLWPRLAGALADKAYDGDDIDWVLHSTTADLVDETRDNETLTCRLFHQALSDHLRGPAELQRQRQQALAGALEATVPERPDHAGRDWACASTYVRTNLATHAAAAGVLDHLLEDPDYVIAADPPRLLRALPAADSPAVADIRRAYQRVSPTCPPPRPPSAPPTSHGRPAHRGHHPRRAGRAAPPRSAVDCSLGALARRSPNTS